MALVDILDWNWLRLALELSLGGSTLFFAHQYVMNWRKLKSLACEMAEATMVGPKEEISPKEETKVDSVAASMPEHKSLIADWDLPKPIYPSTRERVLPYLIQKLDYIEIPFRVPLYYDESAKGHLDSIGNTFRKGTEQGVPGYKTLLDIISHIVLYEVSRDSLVSLNGKIDFYFLKGPACVITYSGPIYPNHQIHHFMRGLISDIKKQRG